MTEERSGKDKKKKKWQLEINWWLGKPVEGVWVREAVATNVRRTFTHHTKGKGWTKREPVIVTETVEEICYAHQGYRPKFEKEKSTRKAFYFRGARLWRS